MIATATLAWGINLPAHLVVIKGTEYFDGKVQRYVDFPITGMLKISLSFYSDLLRENPISGIYFIILIPQNKK